MNPVVFQFPFLSLRVVDQVTPLALVALPEQGERERERDREKEREEERERKRKRKRKRER